MNDVFLEAIWIKLKCPKGNTFQRAVKNILETHHADNYDGIVSELVENCKELEWNVRLFQIRVFGLIFILQPWQCDEHGRYMHSAKPLPM